MKVRDLANENGEWNWQLLHGWLPQEILNIRAIIPPNTDNGDAIFILPESGDGSNSAKDMYNELLNIDEQVEIA